ncbi:DUF58 domain-containing protein [Sinomonas sp. JGH33]|uniref:DUF58 domain-containing protein n=1 Tax=Sinomonas terricola TaxID=3110330 RepID=A0ABU5T9M9_9MICC|nr:DUF58 domain-containing protein [Sinomonas sp. JGH33]MEA5456391.1 DUF58 domain-containing protein [Sinomonas sp. JGH33]
MSEAVGRRFGGLRLMPSRLGSYAAPAWARVQPIAASIRSGVRSVVERSAPVRAILRSKLAIVSLAGWVCLGALAGSLGLSLLLGWRELWAAALVILALFFVAIVFVLGKDRHQVTIDLASTRVVVGERAVGRLRVSGDGREARATNIELPVGRALATFAVPHLKADEELEELFTIPTQRRGVLQLGPARSVKSDPLGLLRRERSLTEPEQLYIHPRTVALTGTSTGLLRDLDGVARQRLSNDDISFHALREYAPGDDRRHIHWKSSARSQRLMVRQFEETRRSQVAILLSSHPTEYSDPEEFELAVSVAGSIGLNALADSKTLTLMGPHRALVRHTRNQLLDGLAGVELDGRSQRFDEQAGTVAAQSPGTSLVVLVAGTGIETQHFRRAAARLPFTASCVGVRVDPKGDLGRRTAGELTVVTVPRLEDLAVALRKGVG